MKKKKESRLKDNTEKLPGGETGGPEQQPERDKKELWQFKINDLQLLPEIRNEVICQ